MVPSSCVGGVVAVALLVSQAFADPVAPATSFPRPSLAPAAPSEAREPRVPGALLFSGGLGFGDSAFSLDGRFGMVAHRNVALFLEALGVGTGDGGGWLGGGGVRVMTDWVFLDARYGRMSVSHSCDFDDPCTTDHFSAAVVGVGIELLHSQHAGLELRADGLHARGETIIQVGLAVSLYLF